MSVQVKALRQKGDYYMRRLVEKKGEAKADIKSPCEPVVAHYGCVYNSVPTPTIDLYQFIRSKPNLNYGAGRDFGVRPEFGAMRKQPIIPGNSRACSCAGEEDRVTWLDLRPG